MTTQPIPSGWRRPANRKPQMGVTDARVLRAIRDWYTKHDYGPSVRDLCALSGYSSTSQVNGALRRLHHAGHITRAENRARTVRLAD